MSRRGKDPGEKKQRNRRKGMNDGQTEKEREKYVIRGGKGNSEEISQRTIFL